MASDHITGLHIFLENACFAQYFELPFSYEYSRLCILNMSIQSVWYNKAIGNEDTWKTWVVIYVATYSSKKNEKISSNIPNLLINFHLKLFTLK